MTENKNNDHLTERIDLNLGFILFLFMCISSIAIYSAQQTQQYDENFVMKQLMWYGVGILVLVGTLWFDLDQLKRLTWYLYGFGNIVLLLLVFAPDSIVPEINGAKSWIRVPGMGSFQPSELVKVFLILALSTVIINHREKVIEHTIKQDLYLLFKLTVVTFVPISLVMMQPDLGTSLVMIAILSAMMFISGVSWRLYMLLFLSAAALIGGILYTVIRFPTFANDYLGVKQYQLGRIYSWLDPEKYGGAEAYQLQKSLLAIGSGKINGKGYTEGSVYIPEAHTDFIIALIGEEFGFLGVGIVITLFFLLVYQIVKIAIETNETFGSYLCTGVVALFTFHAFQNIGMSIGLLPITGIPLPFISYGGSSLLGSMLAMGLVFNVKFNTRHYMFDDRS